MQRSFKVLVIPSIIWNGGFLAMEGEAYLVQLSIRYPSTDARRWYWIKHELRSPSRLKTDICQSMLLSLPHITLQARTDRILGHTGVRGQCCSKPVTFSLRITVVLGAVWSLWEKKRASFGPIRNSSMGHWFGMLLWNDSFRCLLKTNVW